jgi:hypothetical protein
VGVRGIEMGEIASRLRTHLACEPDDPLMLAHDAGMWLTPRLGKPCERFGRRVVYDPSADHWPLVARHVVCFLLEAEGFTDLADVPPEQLDALARMLMSEQARPSSAARRAQL